ncbi:transpeptidase family protein [bacterium]|nr:transpeptidase family protein [bacterium]
MTNYFHKIRKRTRIISIFLLLFWGALIGRLFTIQVINSTGYQESCKNQADYRRIIHPIRGTINDRNQKALTMDIVQYNIAIHPYLIKNKEKIAGELSALIKPKYAAYLKTLQSDRTFVWLERDILHSEIQPFLEKYQYHSGFAIEQKVHRSYPFGEIAGQLIGLTDIDNHGIVGLEKELEPFVCGTPGWRVAMKDGWGRLNNRPDLPYKETINGNDITLTIDHEYQIILHEELLNAFEQHNADKTMGIIINPNNGEILAMSTIPGFDPNMPNNYPVSAQINSVVTDIFEPGSTFKIVTATAAFEGDKVQPGDSIYCEDGHIKIGKNIIHDHIKYSTLSFSEVIKKSSNVGTIKVAQKIGKDQVFNYARRYGFGAKTDIQFPGEHEGIIHPLKKWNDLMLAQVTIGHGVCCTALQLANAYAAIANGGYLLKPQLVKKIETKDGILLYEGKPQYIRRVASAETMILMRDLLRLTVKSGTGLNADINGMAIAGKTGTAQKVTEKGYSQTDYVATFVGFFPVNDPKLLCVIVVDNPKGLNHTGGSVSAPVVKEIFKRIVNLSDDLFFQEDQLQTPQLKLVNSSLQAKLSFVQTAAAAPRESRVRLSTYQYTQRMPDLRGKPLRQAVAILQTMNVDVNIQGTGVVTSQYPQVNSPVTSNTQCTINLEPRSVNLE